MVIMQPKAGKRLAMAREGHPWSPLVIPGHLWSLVVTQSGLPQDLTTHQGGHRLFLQLESKTL